MGDCCDNVCASGSRDPGQRRALAGVLIINAVMFLVILIAALFAKSSALLSGSIDNLGDAFTYALSLYAVSGTRRAKARVSLVKGILILVAALAVGLQVGYRLANPAVPVFEIMGTMTVLALIANVSCLLILRRHRGDDINMASVWECARNDVIENLAVLLAAAGVWLTRSQWPDTVIALLLVLIFLRSGIRIVRRSLAEASL